MRDLDDVRLVHGGLLQVYLSAHLLRLRFRVFGIELGDLSFIHGSIASGVELPQGWTLLSLMLAQSRTGSLWRRPVDVEAAPMHREGVIGIESILVVVDVGIHQAHLFGSKPSLLINDTQLIADLSFLASSLCLFPVKELSIPFLVDSWILQCLL